MNDGFRNWKKPNYFDVHVGEIMSAHRIAMKRLKDFKNQNSSILAALYKQMKNLVDSVRDGNDNKRGVNCCFNKFKYFSLVFAELD